VTKDIAKRSAHDALRLISADLGFVKTITPSRGLRESRPSR